MLGTHGNNVIAAAVIVLIVVLLYRRIKGRSDASP